MKTNLLRILKALLYPLVWCRRTVLEASALYCDSDPVPCSNSVNRPAPGDPCFCCYDVRRHATVVTPGKCS